MKLIITFLIFLSFILTPHVLARTADPSRLPDYEPLRPPAEDTFPNVTGNINSSQEEQKSATESEKDSNAGSEEVGSGNGSDSNSVVPAEGNKPNEGSGRIWLVVAAVFGLILLYGFFRQKSSKK